MVIMERTDEASEFLRAIARWIFGSHGILAEEAGDFIGDFARHLEKCAENHGFDDVFVW